MNLIYSFLSNLLYYYKSFRLAKRWKFYFIATPICFALIFFTSNWVETVAASTLAFSMIIGLPAEVRFSVKARQREGFHRLANPSIARYSLIFSYPPSPELTQKEINQIAAQYDGAVITREDPPGTGQTIYRVEYDNHNKFQKDSMNA